MERSVAGLVTRPGTRSMTVAAQNPRRAVSLCNQQEGLRRMRKRCFEYVLDRLREDEFHLCPDRVGQLPQVLPIRLWKDDALDSRALRRQHLLLDAAYRQAPPPPPNLTGHVRI